MPQMQQSRGLNKQTPSVKRFDAPKSLSIFDNSEDTLSYFSDIVKYLQNKKRGSHPETLYINIEDVDTISIDAIMYLLAIFRNVKLHGNLKINFMGNFSRNPEVNIQIVKSGFSKYVSMRNKAESNGKKVDCIQILTGKETREDIAQHVVDYTCNKLSVSEKHTKFLYRIIIELMTNTKNHAYEIKNSNNGPLKLQDDWYLYAEDTIDCVKFIFLDTGEGIPRTIRKKMSEKLLDITNKFFGNIMLDSKSIKDSEYIYSTFMGESRTVTQLPYRGNGLPAVYRCCELGQIQNFEVISGHGLFKYNEVSPLSKDNIGELFTGTLFYWEIGKERFDGTTNKG